MDGELAAALAVLRASVERCEWSSFYPMTQAAPTAEAARARSEERIPHMADVKQAELSPVREVILIAIAEHLDRHGYAPSMKEIARRAGLESTNTVSYHLDWLEENGYIKRDRNVARSIVLLEEVAL